MDMNPVFGFKCRYNLDLIGEKWQRLLETSTVLME